MQRRGQRPAAADVQDAARPPARGRAGHASSRCSAFPVIRDLVTDVDWNYEVNKRIPPFTPAPDAEWSIGQEDVDRIERVPQVHRVLPLPGRLPRPARPQHARALLRPALPRPHREPRDAPARHARPARTSSRTRAASGSATSRSAAPRSAPRASTSPTTRSSRSRSASSTSATTRCCACSAGSGRWRVSTSPQQACSFSPMRAARHRGSVADHEQDGVGAGAGDGGHVERATKPRRCSTRWPRSSGMHWSTTHEVEWPRVGRSASRRRPTSEGRHVPAGQRARGRGQPAPCRDLIAPRLRLFSADRAAPGDALGDVRGVAAIEDRAGA